MCCDLGIVLGRSDLDFFCDLYALCPLQDLLNWQPQIAESNSVQCHKNKIESDLSMSLTSAFAGVSERIWYGS